MTFGTPKSVMTSVKTMKPVLRIPYFAPGNVTVQNMRHLGVRKASAASYSLASAVESAVIKIISA